MDNGARDLPARDIILEEAVKSGEARLRKATRFRLRRDSGLCGWQRRQGRENNDESQKQGGRAE